MPYCMQSISQAKLQGLRACFLRMNLLCMRTNFWIYLAIVLNLYVTPQRLVAYAMHSDYILYSIKYCSYHAPFEANKSGEVSH